MKKIFTLVFMALMTSFAFAQNAKEVLQFVDKDGNVVPDGSVVNITEGEEDFWGDLMFPTGLYVTNSYDEDLDLRVDYNVTSLPNGSFQICFPMSCMYANATGSYKTNSGSMKAGEKRDLQAEWIPTKEAYGTCSVELQLVLTKGLGSKGPKITVNMIYSDPASVNNLNGKGATEVARYNAAGQRIDADQRGLHIVKLSNGKTMKVMQK
jgi:hypothetical protein